MTFKRYEPTASSNNDNAAQVLSYETYIQLHLRDLGITHRTRRIRKERPDMRYRRSSTSRNEMTRIPGHR